MKVLTFNGTSPAQALKKAQAAVGEDAMLIETKEIRKKSLTQSALYEIIVGIDDEIAASLELKERQKAQEARAPVAKSSADVLYNISEAARQISKIAEVTNEEPFYHSDENKSYKNDKIVARVKEKSNDPAEFKDIKDEILKLGDKVKLIQNMFWDERSDKRGNLHIPPEFSEIYKLTLESGMNAKHIEEIMALTLEHMPLKMRENSQTVKRYFQVLLRKMVPVRMESTPKKNAKKVIMLVGPTGVGKTTSIAKLAARYSFMMEKKYKVGLIVLDTYRIGAVEQLMQYARMMKLGIETVVDPPEFASALNAMSYCDYILIDTMGSSPYDKEKITKIYECLQNNTTQMSIDTVLVLPSSIKYEDLKATYDNFESLGIDTMMFTKLDETRGFGNIFSLMYETSKPISYFSVGQEVPEDLVVASSDYLIECMLNGFKRDDT
ncbi:flagellar biosynthesis protein FlhF [Sulfurimonas sp. MAG313]|nr:flagellar biosynthesis protein FlhF [Sulfurimonas sp. MAG313]MDF1879899.1 flagellar biosynthesis protein FlhF [Sulfurimonas sp. MAG313]